MIYVPYAKLSSATVEALRPYEATYVEMDGDDGYPKFLAERWAGGEAFVNVEHDVVPWPGAIEELVDCPEPWCGFGYGDDNPTPVLGCVKLTSELMQAIPTVWDEMLDQPNVWSVQGIPGWSYCDLWLAQKAEEAGVRHHQHVPPVENRH